MRLISILVSLALVSGCTTLPVSGRKQLNFIPYSQLTSLSNDQYEQLSSTLVLSIDKNETTRLSGVGKRVAIATEEFMRRNGMENRIKDYTWEFKLFKDDSVINAFCLPGGKIGVYTGILKVTQDDSGLATVLSHEAAHAILDHGGERLSQLMLVQLGGVTLSQALRERSEETRQLSMMAYGVGANLGFVMPYSRVQEYEADRVGLIIMAIAGYDPEKALGFWERMKKAGSLMPVEFLSTHPVPENRIKMIKSSMPEAEKYYNRNSSMAIKNNAVS